MRKQNSSIEGGATRREDDRGIGGNGLSLSVSVVFPIDLQTDSELKREGCSILKSDVDCGRSIDRDRARDESGWVAAHHGDSHF
jgi:hypothetical protein